MGEVRALPLSAITGLNGAVPRLEGEALIVETPRQTWAYAAEASWDVAAAAEWRRTVTVRVEVRSGVLGIGFLTPDETGWVTRTAAGAEDGATEARLVLPAGAAAGKLIFDNWTADDQPCLAIVKAVELLATDPKRHYAIALDAEERGDRQLAIGHYQAALRDDPLFTEAIAGLGRLRFVPPPQPLTDAIKRRTRPDVCEVVVQIRNPCNFRCFYCVAADSNNTPVERLQLDHIERAYGAIDSKLVVTSFECGGGEPTVHPQFADLVRVCARHGAVSFPSNNSQNPRRWLPRETASRIMVRATLHPEGEARIGDFIANACYLIDAGCRLHLQFIAHPTRIGKIPEYRALFASHGLSLTAVSFIGAFEGRSYPHAYTEEERRLIGLSEPMRLWAQQVEPHTTRIRNFRGIPCIAGFRSIYITADGGLRRCNYDLERKLSHPLPAPEPCGVDQCGCGLVLEKLNSVQTVDFYNSWGWLVGLEPIETDWIDEMALALGYRDREAAQAADAIAMYDALMAAYGKDEAAET